MNNKVFLGKDVNNVDFILDLDLAQNVLLTGTTGGGKSICLHRILFNLLHSNRKAEFVLIDPKCVEFSKYKNLKNVSYFTYKEFEEMTEYLNKLLAKAEKLTNDVFVVVDEMADVGDMDRKYVKPFLNLLVNPNKHIHLLIATQRSCANSIKNLRKYIPNRLCFCVASLAESLSVIRKGGLEKLVGRGDCIAVIDNQFTHFQVDMIYGKDIRELVSQLSNE